MATKELFGGERGTTNNRMELTAVIEALASLKRSCDVVITRQRKYVRKGMTRWIANWMRQGLEDRRWQTSEERRPLATARCAAQAAPRGLALGQGHAGDPGNETPMRWPTEAWSRCDESPCACSSCRRAREQGRPR